MTALAGLWAYGSGQEPHRSVERMLGAQSIYAPAAAAIWREDHLALGRRLHPLLPEDSHDRRPVVGSDGSVLIADVRLDDRDELARMIGLDAAETKVLADSALVARAFQKWGDETPERLYGDFAIARWEPDRRRLLLARDALGERPLHFHRGRGFFALASMPKGLHALPEVPLAPDPATAADHLVLLPDTGTETFFAQIEKLPPGSRLIVTPETVQLERWWRPSVSEQRLAHAGDYQEALRAELDRAVSTRLRRARGAVASHLSGGLDSSAVAATAAQLLAPEELLAYTAVPGRSHEGKMTDQVILDEGPLAASVARLHPNIQHHLIRGESRSPLDDLDRNLFLYESPYLNLENANWLHLINDAAKASGATVLLVGMSGNVSFSYDGHHRFPALLERGALFTLAREAMQAVRGGTRAGTVAAATLGPFLPRAAWRKVRRWTNRERDVSRYSAIRPEVAARISSDPRLAERGLDLDYRPHRDGMEARLWRLRRVDRGNYNKGTFAGWGLDVRDPAADRRLVEFCLSVPLEHYMVKGVPRALARTAFADRLPAELLGERRKGMQSADWGEQMSGSLEQLRHELDRIGSNPAATGLIDLPRLQRALDDWPASNWHRPEIVETYRLALLRGVATGHFIRKVSGTN